MKVIIDRIEVEIAVVEKEDGSFENMPKSLIPPEAKQGDVLIIRVDPEGTKERQQRIASLMDELWDK